MKNTQKPPRLLVGCSRALKPASVPTVLSPRSLPRRQLANQFANLFANPFASRLASQFARLFTSSFARLLTRLLTGLFTGLLAGLLTHPSTRSSINYLSANHASCVLPVCHGWQCYRHYIVSCAGYCWARLVRSLSHLKNTCVDRLSPKLSCEPLAFLVNLVWIILPSALLGGCAVDASVAKGTVNPASAPPLSLTSPQALAQEEHQWLSEATGGGVLESGVIKTNTSVGALQQAAAISPDALVGAEPIEDASAQRLSLQATGLSLHALLFSLAGDAGLELVMNDVPDVPVTLAVQNVRLSSLLEQISRQAPIVWSIADQRLSIRADEPYRVTYPIDYLNVSRQSRSSVGLATRVGSISLNIAGDTGSGDTDNSSQTLIENESIHNFWDSLSTDLTQLLQPYDGDAAASVVINREAGLVSVWAKQHAHREISDYLSLLTHSASRQVLIEATIVEVTLSDQFQAGVDWQALGSGLDGSADSSVVNFAQSLHGQPEVNAGSVNKLPSPSALLSAIHQSNSLGRISATLSLLQTFGDVKILSRPQIIAINNQAAVLKVVDNRVYFSVSVERQSGEDTEDITTATTIHTVPVGLVMSVTPFVASDNSVILNVRPTISRILGFVNDPNPALSQASVVNGVPEIQVREMESVLKVGDGQIAMIGGLMQQQQSNNESGVPGLSRLPGVGHLFRQRGNSQRKTELLVFMRPVVLPATQAIP